MLGKLRDRFTYANVMATIAVFLALGGGTTAVALQGRNTVDSGDIINGQVKSADVRNDNLRGGDVRDGTLTGSDILNDTLGSADVAEPDLAQVPSAALADDASALAGISAGQYQRECARGANVGYVVVKASATFPSSYTDDEAFVPEQYKYSCSNQQIQVRRVAQGDYRVWFAGRHHAVAVGNVREPNNDAYLSYAPVFDSTAGGAGGFDVIRVVTRDADGGTEDAEFSLTLLSGSG